MWTNSIGSHVQKVPRVTKHTEGENIMAVKGWGNGKLFSWHEVSQAERGSCREWLSSVLPTVNNAASTHLNTPVNQPHSASGMWKIELALVTVESEMSHRLLSASWRARKAGDVIQYKPEGLRTRGNDGASLCAGPATINKEEKGRGFPSLLCPPCYPVPHCVRQ